MAYCANPVETVDLLTDNCEWIAGNCEKQLADGAGNCGCGFEDGSTCDVLSRGWFPFVDRAISVEQRHRFSLCPDMVVFEHCGLQCAVIHGGFTDVSRVIWPISDADVFAEEIDAIQKDIGSVDIVFCGHSGIAFQRKVGDVLWVNAGAIGMPPHDGQTTTQYASLNSSGVHVESLNYDYNAAADEMTKVGLVQGYEKALKTGIWPSEDILPLTMRR